MTTAIDVARYLLHLSNEESEPDPITHLRLQKVLYYCQGWSLGMRQRPLFTDRVEAWSHGPVVPSVYRIFANHDRDAIPRSEGHDTCVMSSDDKTLVERIWDHYKRYSATELRRMTHQESPWVDARGDRHPDDRTDAEITTEAMQSFFGEQRRLASETLRKARNDFVNGRSVPFETLLAELS